MTPEMTDAEYTIAQAASFGSPYATIPHSSSQSSAKSDDTATFQLSSPFPRQIPRKKLLEEANKAQKLRPQPIDTRAKITASPTFYTAFSPSRPCQRTCRSGSPNSSSGSNRRRSSSDIDLDITFQCHCPEGCSSASTNNDWNRQNIQIPLITQPKSADATTLEFQSQGPADYQKDMQSLQAVTPRRRTRSAMELRESYAAQGLSGDPPLSIPITISAPYAFNSAEQARRVSAAAISTKEDEDVRAWIRGEAPISFQSVYDPNATEDAFSYNCTPPIQFPPNSPTPLIDEATRRAQVAQVSRRKTRTNSVSSMWSFSSIFGSRDRALENSVSTIPEERRDSTSTSTDMRSSFSGWVPPFGAFSFGRRPSRADDSSVYSSPMSSQFDHTPASETNSPMTDISSGFVNYNMKTTEFGLGHDGDNYETLDSSGTGTTALDSSYSTSSTHKKVTRFAASPPARDSHVRRRTGSLVVSSDLSVEAFNLQVLNTPAGTSSVTVIDQNSLKKSKDSKDSDVDSPVEEHLTYNAPAPVSRQPSVSSRARPRTTIQSLNHMSAAKLLFYVGFVLGPWCWLIGGYCLRSFDGEPPEIHGTRCRLKGCNCGKMIGWKSAAEDRQHLSGSKLTWWGKKNIDKWVAYCRFASIWSGIVVLIVFILAIVYAVRYHNI